MKYDEITPAQIATWLETKNMVQMCQHVWREAYKRGFSKGQDDARPSRDHGSNNEWSV